MLLDRLSEFIAGISKVHLSDDVRHDTRRCVLDWFAATIPGGTMAPATLLADALDGETGNGGAMLIPGGRRAGMRAAALINGSAAHVLEFDDIYRDAIYHPGAPVISAALAVAQARGLSGETFMRAVIAGYEISGRIGARMLPAHYEYWHPTGTVGSLGAAAAASSLLGLDAGATGHALATAATMAAGLQQAFRSDAMSKPLHAGRAAEAGVLAALAAQRGVTGAHDVLEGRSGFGAAMSRDVDWDAVTEGLGESWVVNDMTQKNHACCGHVFAAVDSMLALKAEHGLTPDDVRRIRVGTYSTAIEVAGNPDPATVFEAKFSLPYCVAVALATGRARLAAFAEPWLSDPALRDLMARVELAVDAKADRQAPNARSATVEVETGDGRRLSHFSPTRKGDPDNPLSDAELDEKFDELAVPVIGEAAAAALKDILWRIDGLDDMAELTVVDPQPSASVA